MSTRTITNLLVLVVICSWLTIIWCWEPAFLTLTVDDSFYYFKTALNISEGHGASFDKLNITNGFHPLWMLILALLSYFVVQPSLIFVKIVLSLETLIVFTAAVILNQTFESQKPIFIRLFSFLCLNFYFFKVFVNGLESAILFLCISLALYRFHRSLVKSDNSRKNLSILGVLAGLTGLARVDAVFFSATFCFLTSFTLSHRDTNFRFTEFIKNLLVTTISCGLVIGPYFLWNILVYGHITPVSASIKIGDATVNFRMSIVALGSIIALIIPLVSLKKAGLFEKGSLGIRFSDHSLAVIASPLFSYAAFTILVNLGLRGIRIPEIWYLSPIFASFVLLSACKYASLEIATRTRLKKTFVLCFLIFTAITWSYRVNPATWVSYKAAMENGLWLRDNTSLRSLAAGWSCGIAAYFSDRQFINLDGLINSWTYKTDYLDTAKTDVFIQQVQPVDYVVDYLPVSTLMHSTCVGHVNLANYCVARFRIIRTRLFTNPFKEVEVCYFVLSRSCTKDQIRFSDLASKLIQGRERKGSFP